MPDVRFPRLKSDDRFTNVLKIILVLVIFLAVVAIVFNPNRQSGLAVPMSDNVTYTIFYVGDMPCVIATDLHHSGVGGLSCDWSQCDGCADAQR